LGKFNHLPILVFISRLGLRTEDGGQESRFQWGLGRKSTGAQINAAIRKERKNERKKEIGQKKNALM
jgi:hypothetical protein